MSNKIEYWIHKYNHKYKHLYSKNNWKETETSFLKWRTAVIFKTVVFAKSTPFQNLPLCGTFFHFYSCIVVGRPYFFASIFQIKENFYVHGEYLLIYFDILLIGKECGFSIKFLKLFKIMLSFKVGWFTHLISYCIFKNRT